MDLYDSKAINQMNDHLFWAALAIGAVTEFLTKKNLTQAEQVGIVSMLVVSALALGVILPEEINFYVECAVFVLSAGRVSGQYIGRLVDKHRDRKEARKIEGIMDYGKSNRTKQT